MARITIYKNSIMANVCSLFGSVFMFAGIGVLFSGEILGGIVAIAGGVGLNIWGSNISANKQFKKWKKQVESKGLTSAIASSDHTAITVYNTYPCKKSLEYIRSLNPRAAQEIDRQLSAKK